MNRILAAAAALLPALALAGCPDDTPTNQPTTGTGVWRVQWEYGDTTECPLQAVSGDYHWAMVWRGTDTITITSQNGGYTGEGVAVIETMDLRGLGKCADPPGTTWSEIVATQQPTMTGAPYASVRIQPVLTPATPTQILVSTGGLFQPGLGTHRTLPLGSETNEFLGDGVFTFDARFAWPLTDGAAFDSTWSYEQGGLRTFRVHATLHRIR